MDTMPILGADERLDRINENLTLIQKKNGLTFGTDAFLLAAFVRPQRRAVAVDLGSGTGIIPLLLRARGKIAMAHAVEIQSAFAALIERNAACNGMQHEIFSHCADLRTLHAAALSQEGVRCEAVDIVTANPPYMAVDAGARNRDDEKYIARHEVAGNVSDFCACAARLLRSGGSFYCVWRPDRLSVLMRALADNRLEPKRMVFIHADEVSEASSVLIEARKDGAPYCHLLPPLLLHTQDSRSLPHRPLTPRAQHIYDTMQWSDTEEGN